MSHIVITGAQGGETQGAVAPNRLEINDLINDLDNHDMFSLYIQALNVMYDTSQVDQLSHFGIGGIHGLPYAQWQGSGGTDPVSGSQFGGYCTHGTVLFPTWHRPYVALYEQILQQHALDIAKEYKDQDRWLSAAQNLRAPFWDWAANSVPPPEVTSMATVNITTPNGDEDVQNPLIKYTFNPIDKSFTSPWKYWQTTIRHPDDPNSPNATTDVDALEKELLAIQGDITDSTRSLLLRVHTWPAFSNHTPGDGGSISNSLEAIHDKIHGSIGGHMFNVAYAGFDPIFYLHHANVDRLLSLWAAIHPGVWVSDGSAETGTFTLTANADINENTDLTPFWISKSYYWSSSYITESGILRYTYPEFNNLKLGDPDAVQIAIALYVFEKYGGFTFPFGGPGPVIPPSQHASSSDAPAPAAQASVLLSQTAQQSLADTVRDWAVRIHFKKYELGGSFSVLIFLGDVPEDPSQWRTSPSFVGAHVAFVNSVPNQCANCREQAETVVEGFIHLNRSIAKLSKLSSFEPSEVTPYLQKHLHWRIQGADRAVIEQKSLPSLEVTVAETLLSQAPGAVLPTRGEAQYHHHITFDKAGGARNV